MISATYSFFKSFYTISINSQPLKVNQLASNLEKIMIFSVSNAWIQQILDFAHDSVNIAVIDLVQSITISSQEKPLAAWQLLLSQMQDFLDNHLPRVPITQNQEGTVEMREEVLSNVGAQDLDTSSYQVSYHEDIDLNWETSQRDTDAAFRPGINFDQASKCIQIPLPNPKFEIGSTKSRDLLFAHHYDDIIEHSSRQLRLSFRFGNNNSCVFSLKKFELHGNQFTLTEILVLNHREIHLLYKARFYVANKCELIESNYKV